MSSSVLSGSSVPLLPEDDFPDNVLGNFEGDETSTHSDSDLQEVPSYAILKFPDAEYFVRKLSVVVGRDCEPLSRTTSVGGIGGPQQHSLPEPDEPYDEERINVNLPVDPETNEGPRNNSISRVHLRIRWSASDQTWVTDIIGRNGAWVDTDYYESGQTAILSNGTRITIRQLEFYFHVPEGDEDLESESEDDSANESLVFTDEEREAHNGSPSTAEEEESDRSPAIEDDGEGKAEVQRASRGRGKVRRRPPTHGSKPNVRTNRKTKRRVSDGTSGEPSRETQQDELTGKKRGPGRPPKDGIMSKKERREREKCQALGIDYDEKASERLKDRKDKSKSNNKDPKTETKNGVKTGVKRKREGEDRDAVERAESEAESDQPPRSPSPKIEDFTEEQLRKPDLTYYDQLYIILKEAGEPLSLPRIYDAMKKKWPHFRFKVDTNGWESSVRHNLQQHEGDGKAFRKGDKAGKGWFWKLNPDFHYEAKAKKSVPTYARTPTYVSNSNGPYSTNMFRQPAQHISHSYVPALSAPYAHPIAGGSYTRPSHLAANTPYSSPYVAQQPKGTIAGSWKSNQQSNVLSIANGGLGNGSTSLISTGAASTNGNTTSNGLQDNVQEERPSSSRSGNVGTPLGPSGNGGLGQAAPSEARQSGPATNGNSSGQSAGGPSHSQSVYIPRTASISLTTSLEYINRGIIPDTFRRLKERIVESGSGNAEDVDKAIQWIKDHPGFNYDYKSTLQGPIVELIRTFHDFMREEVQSYGRKLPPAHITPRRPAAQ